PSQRQRIDSQQRRRRTLARTGPRIRRPAAVERLRPPGRARPNRERAPPARERTPPARGLSRRSLAAPLFAQLGPIVQAFSDLALEPALGRIVQCLPAERFGQIVLAGAGIGRIV